VEDQQMAKWIERDVRFAHYIAEGLDPSTGDGLTCACCGKQVRPGAHTSAPDCASLDHMTPRATTGARYDIRPTNLIVLCGPCNRNKSADDMATFLASARWTSDEAAAAWGRIGERLARKGDMAPYIQASRAAGFGKKK
jgi:5-methylcytosine-specific restriction endonuclease McrA